MKIGFSSTICGLFLAGAMFGQSLGDVAKKEKKRREENQGAARVIDNNTLDREAQRRDQEAWQDKIANSGKLPSPTATTRTGSSRNETPSTGPRDPGAGFIARTKAADDNMTDSERRREQARRDGIQKLESIFRAMERPARELVRLVGIYQNCTSGKLNRGCDSQLPPIGLKAIEVGRHMDEAQTVARTSYITPGELRDVRDRLGLDHRIWDLTVRLAAKYRNVR